MVGWNRPLIARAESPFSLRMAARTEHAAGFNVDMKRTVARELSLVKGLHQTESASSTQPDGSLRAHEHLVDYTMYAVDIVAHM